MEKIKNILVGSKSRYNIAVEMNASRICYVAKEASDGVFEPISFKDGLLTIKAANSIVAQEIQLESTQIIKKINQKLGKNMVDRIRFKIENV